MELLVSLNGLSLPASDDWVDVGAPIPSERASRLAAAALSDREIQIRLVQGVLTSPGEYEWLRASSSSVVPAGELGSGLLSEVGFPRSVLQARNESGQTATVTAYVFGGG